MGLLILFVLAAIALLLAELPRSVIVPHLDGKLTLLHKEKATILKN